MSRTGLAVAVPDLEPPPSGALATLRLVPPPESAPGTISPPARPGGRPLALSSDARLARMVREQGAAPLSVLYRRHGPDLYRFALGMVGNPHDAADASQETWLRAFVALRRGPDVADRLRPWLFTIARNACLDRLRARGRTSLHELDEADLGLAPSPEEAHAARAEVTEVLGDLARLDPLRRSGLVMRDVAGLSHDEIASALGITATRSRTLTTEARSFLQDRRAGRSMPCAQVAGEIGRLRLRDRRVRAHIDDCSRCGALERRERARRLSSLALVPFEAVRSLAARLGAWLGADAALSLPALKPAGAAIAVALAAGGAVAVPGGDGTRGERGPAPRTHEPVARVAVEATARAHRPAPTPRRPLARPGSDARPRGLDAARAGPESSGASRPAPGSPGDGAPAAPASVAAGSSLPGGGAQAGAALDTVTRVRAVAESTAEETATTTVRTVRTVRRRAGAEVAAATPHVAAPADPVAAAAAGVVGS